MRTREQLAYAAGLYEGEGTITSKWAKYKIRDELRISKTPNYQLKINMTDEQPLENFLAAVDIGVIYGPYPGSKSGYKDMFMYQAGGLEKVQAIIAMLWPWLSYRRREQAIKVLTMPKRV